MLKFLNELGEVAVQIWPILLIVGAIVLTLVIPDKKNK